MLRLLMALIYRVGLIIMIGLVFSRTKSFKNIFKKKELSLFDKITMAILFGMLSIIGTYSGIHYQGAIVNTRVIGVAVGGLLGGPLVGILSGLIAGSHRFLVDIGGFTAVSCGISTFVEGLLAGLVSHYFKKSNAKIAFALIVGVVLESIQMIIILLIARPLSDAIELVSVISFSMILVNSLGIALFISIISNIQELSNIQATVRARQALIIADKTTEAVREGLNKETALKTVKQILNATDFDAVAMTDRNEILAHVGLGADHHIAGKPILTGITKTVLRKGETLVVQSEEHIDCPETHCPLKAAIVVPIYNEAAIIGTLKFYRSSQTMSDIDIEIANGLSSLLSTQVRVSTLEERAKLALSAEIKALQAQINPHFFFNTLNVIGSLIRTDQDKARELLIDLSDYLRKNMQSLEGEITLTEEIGHIEKFMNIIRARFGNAIQFETQIEVPQEVTILPLLIQPIVENAILHGVVPRGAEGKVVLAAKVDVDQLLIQIRDDGVGIDADRIRAIMTNVDDSAIGIYNVKQRIEKHYSNQGQFIIESEKWQGTCVTLLLPFKVEGL